MWGYRVGDGGVVGAHGGMDGRGGGHAGTHGVGGHGGGTWRGGTRRGTWRGMRLGAMGQPWGVLRLDHGHPPPSLLPSSPPSPRGPVWVSPTPRAKATCHRDTVLPRTAKLMPPPAPSPRCPPSLPLPGVGWGMSPAWPGASRWNVLGGRAWVALVACPHCPQPHSFLSEGKRKEGWEGGTG